MVFLEKIAKWTIAGLAVLLAFSAFFVSPETAFPAVFLRVIVVRVVVEVMVVIYIFLALFFPQYRPKKSTIAYAVGAFLLAFLLSTIFGINAYRSFWGSHERMEGFVTFLHFGALFFVLFGAFQKPEEFKKVLWASVAVSVVQSFYGFGQLPAFSIQATKLYANETSRISGTFGNATIFALYLIFQIFFAIMLFFWEKKSWAKWILAGVFFIDLLAVFYSGTRGALLGTTFGVVLIGTAYALFSGSKKLRLAGLGAVLLVVGFFVVLNVFRNTPFVLERNILQRATIFSSAISTISSRSLAWKIGINGWKDRFWFGYGMDNFNYVFNRYYDPWMAYYDSGDFDRPHNRFVDSIVTGGFFGIVTHLAVFATAAWFLLKRWWKNKSFFFPLAAAALLIAYAIQLSTLFDHMISYQFFAIFLALIAVWERSAHNRQPTTNNRQPELGSRNGELGNEIGVRHTPVKIAVVVAITVGMAWFTWIANIVPTEASYWAQVASNTNYASQGKRFGDAFVALKKSFDLNTYLNVDMRLALSGFASSQARGLEGDEGKKFGREVLEYLVDQFEKNLTEHHPDIKDFLSHQTYARIAAYLAEYDPAWNDKALATMKQAVEEYPKKYQLLQGLARMYMQRGQSDEALKVFETHSLIFAPGQYYFDYAAALYSVGRSEDAWKQIELTYINGYDFKKNLSKLVDILLQDKRYDRIVWLYEKQLLSYQKDDTQLMASLAETYKTMGDIGNARRIAQILLEKDPEHRTDTEAFLKELEVGSRN